MISQYYNIVGFRPNFKEKRFYLYISHTDKEDDDFDSKNVKIIWISIDRGYGSLLDCMPNRFYDLSLYERYEALIKMFEKVSNQWLDSDEYSSKPHNIKLEDTYGYIASFSSMIFEYLKDLKNE